MCLAYGTTARWRQKPSFAPCTPSGRPCPIGRRERGWNGALRALIRADAAQKTGGGRDGEALAAGADYCAFGLFIPSPSPGARQDRVEKARLRLGVVLNFHTEETTD